MHLGNLTAWGRDLEKSTLNAPLADCFASEVYSAVRDLSRSRSLSPPPTHSLWASLLAYIHFTFALKAIHITLSRAFKPQFTRESRVTHARGLSTRCEHKHNDCAIGGRLAGSGTKPSHAVNADYSPV